MSGPDDPVAADPVAADPVAAEPAADAAEDTSPFDFTVEATSGRARAGRLRTPHGEVCTPLFMTVGTRGTVKGILPDHLALVGAPVLLGNTYHLWLRPGPEIVEQLGGIHGLMGWDGPILTDSGGYQVFSLAHLGKIDDDGVTFQSTYDGATVRLTPERSMAVQQALGADVIMAFDECPKGDAPREVASAAVDRTLAWARRCRDAHTDGRQVLFGIVQGTTDEALRARCAAALREIGFFGYAMGGLAVGEDRGDMLRVLDHTDDWLPAERPRYLMGVGPPEDLVEAIHRGIDMFDCVVPTRNGRTGQAFTWDGPVNLKNARWRDDPRPLIDDPRYPELLGRFSCAALRHFLKIGEMIGPIVVSLHNLWFYQVLMADARAAVLEGRFPAFREQFLVRYFAGNQP